MNFLWLVQLRFRWQWIYLFARRTCASPPNVNSLNIPWTNCNWNWMNYDSLDTNWCWRWYFPAMVFINKLRLGPLDSLHFNFNNGPVCKKCDAVASIEIFQTCFSVILFNCRLINRGDWKCILFFWAMIYLFIWKYWNRKKLQLRSTSQWMRWMPRNELSNSNSKIISWAEQSWNSPLSHYVFVYLKCK